MQQELLAARAAAKGGGMRALVKGRKSRWRDADRTTEPATSSITSAEEVTTPLAEAPEPAPPPVAVTSATPPPLPPCADGETRPGSEPPLAVISIPSLEPPLPLAARAALRTVSTHWLTDRWRETPSWLASLALHLAVLITLGSLIVPPSKLVSVYYLTVALIEGTADTSQADHTLLLQDTLQSTGGEHGVVKIEAEPLEIAPNPDPPVEENTDTPIPELPNPTDAADVFDAVVGQTPSLPLATRESTPVINAPPPLPGDNVPAALPSNVVAEGRRDTIIDRFIEYDIGKLRGADGEQARRDFDRLGFESIPALVRGLNKSAYIHATCPVGVISSKLQQEVQRSGDRAMIQYALDNIGRDVPDDAPHAQRLKQIRQVLWQRYVADRENVRQTLASRGLPSSEEYVNEVQQLSAASSADLIKRLDSADVQRRKAITAAISLQPVGDLSDQQRIALARRLIEQLQMGDAMLSRQSDQTLNQLTPEFVSRPSVASDPAAAAQQWRQYWDRIEREKLIGPRARSLLAMGDILDERGNRPAAVRRYRELVTDYYGTDAANEAQQRLARIAAEGN